VPTSTEVRAKHNRFLFASQATYYAESVVLHEGKGNHLRDLDGSEYLDFFGGILTVGLGHANDRVNAAVIAQMQRLGHVSTFYPTVPIVELAEKLVGLCPGKLEKVYFTSSGSEADEMAVMLAQAHTGRQELIALRHGYSGRTLIAQTLTGHAKYRVAPPQVPGIRQALAPYCYRCPLGKTYPSCELACAKDIEELIQTSTGGAVAGMLAEPILGVGGFIDPPPGYYELAAAIVRKYGGVFISDEVQTGMGRTGGKMWGIEHHNVEPDIMTMAKGLANGLPVGATVTTAAIASAWKGGNISTFGGNPLTAVAAKTTLDIIEEDHLLDNAQAMGVLLREGLLALQLRYPKLIGEVRGKGLMQALEIVVDHAAGDRSPNPTAVTQLFEETKKRGLLIGRGGLYGNAVRIAPALNIRKADLEDGLRRLEEAFAALAT
jgi:4-aminobutyrate aminotransferase-like enzyme